MKPQLLCFAITGTIFLVLSTIRPVSSQLVGCSAPGMNCSTEDTPPNPGPCSFFDDGVGVVSADSNITTEGRLTWTVVAGDRTGSFKGYQYRDFYLGTPPSLDLATVTSFGACSIPFWNVTDRLQLPANFDDFDNFGCNTVMGDDCAQDLLSQARTEIAAIMSDSTYDPTTQGSPCGLILDKLNTGSFPASCVAAFGTDKPRSGVINGMSNSETLIDKLFPTLTLVSALVLTNNTIWSPNIYQTQQDCSVTTGGSEYNLVEVGSEDTSNIWDNIGTHKFEKPSKDWIELYKDGTTPIMTFFYNEPWNNASTGPVSFLTEPEIHLTCLRPVKSKVTESGSTKLWCGPAPSTAMLAVLGILAWLLMTI